MRHRVTTMMLLAVLILPSVVAAQAEVAWVREYDPTLGEFPEGLAVDLHGNIYVSMAVLGEVRRISPDGTETLFYRFPPAAAVQLLGLTVDASGNIYVCVFSPYAPEYQGIWRIDRRGGAEHLPGSEAIGLPNALAFDPQGNLYVTDSWVPGIVPPEGAVWRIPRGGEAEVWYQDGENLGGLGQIPGYPPLGANGIAYYHRALYVANTERGHIVRIPVLPHGGPGEPVVMWADAALTMVDGIAMNHVGSIFAAVIGQDHIVAICGITGALSVLAAGDPIDGPASVAFGSRNDSLDTLYVTNYAVLSGEPSPGILKLGLEWPPWSKH